METEPRSHRLVIILTSRNGVCVAAAVLFASTIVLYAQDQAHSAGIRPTPPEALANSSPIIRAAAPDYFISPDDELDVYVLDVPEISRSYRVSPAGLLELPLLKEPVSAAGLTPERLSQVIGEELRTSGMVASPHVSVQVKQSRIHSVAITGAVKRPQIYPLFGRTSLLDALAQAEGLADDAGSTAIITRGEIALRALADEPGGPAQITGQADATPNVQAPVSRALKIDLKRLMEDGDPSLNLDLYPGDRVTVQRAGIVYVVGAVNRAGGFVLKNDREQMTVLKAVALAENLKSTAVPKKGVIIRKNPATPDGNEQLAVDLSQILSGHTQDRPLLANDILFVPDSAGKKALHRAGEAAAQAAALFIYRIP